MKYRFPAGLSLAEVSDIVRRHNERLGAVSFIEADRGDHVIFNYVVAFKGSFPPMTGNPDLDREYAILRECRGLTFSKATGKVIARKFHKFFNVNERDETQSHEIDWSAEHVIFEKLDGSMITPFRPDDSARRWGTKMGITDVAIPVEEFVAARPEYDDFAMFCEMSGLTPMLEWCSRKQKIVIDYIEDRLVLTAIRNIETGEYLPYAGMKTIADHYGIPVARVLPHPVGDIAAFLEETRVLQGEEGYVVRFADGHMAKVKAEEYCRIHSTKDGLTHEKDVLALVLSDALDDAKAFMDNDDRLSVERYETAVYATMNAYGTAIALEVDEARALVGDDRKRFATEVAEKMTGHRRALAFQAFQGADMADAVRRIVAKHTASGPRVEEVRDLIGGIHWRDYRTATPIGDE